MNKIQKITKLIKEKREKKDINNAYHDAVYKLTLSELAKEPKRTEVINFLLSLFNRETLYLEIGVRNPDHNFNHINAKNKYSVDPGLAFKENPVDFKMTSDDFFQKLNKGEILSNDIKFDLIFIDGLHLADQVDLDIINAFNYLKEDGFIVLHDCNPPSQWHAREAYEYTGSPAQNYWSGTTWKAFLKWRTNPNVYSCCIDSDWGIGILSKKHQIGRNTSQINSFYEFHELEKNRKEYLNLIDFETLKSLLNQ
ncbi:MAG: class I SAM-dependent methyltransferase [Flavobacteriales bacterium]